MHYLDRIFQVDPFLTEVYFLGPNWNGSGNGSFPKRYQVFNKGYPFYRLKEKLVIFWKKNYFKDNIHKIRAFFSKGLMT